MPTDFDPEKNAANLTKHGLDLAEGNGVLRDPLAITVEDERAQGEARFVTLGANVFGALRVVVWTERDGEPRFISVRRATTKEVRDYESGI